MSNEVPKDSFTNPDNLLCCKDLQEKVFNKAKKQMEPNNKTNGCVSPNGIEPVNWLWDNLTKKKGKK